MKIFHMSADTVFYWSNWLLIVALVLGVIATFAIVRSGNIRDRELKRELKEKDVLIAEANARSQEAQLELEKIKAPRFISHDARIRIINEIKPFKNVSFDIATSTTKEALALVDQIESILNSANWKHLDWNGGSIKRNNKPTLGHAIETGISIQVEIEKENELIHIAKALATALNKEGIQAVEELMPVPQTQNSNSLHIVIGDKPM